MLNMGILLKCKLLYDTKPLVNIKNSKTSDDNSLLKNNPCYMFVLKSICSNSETLVIFEVQLFRSPITFNIFETIFY